MLLAKQPDFDVIHFEALGPEAHHLQKATRAKIDQGALPVGHRMMLTPLTVQAFLSQHSSIAWPSLITTKTHSIVADSFFESHGQHRPGIITRSAGYDHFEHLVARAHVTSLRQYCVDAVAQTAMKFVYCIAGSLADYTEKCATFDRKSCEAFSQLGPHLTLTVFGVGRIGKRVYELAQANGLTVQGVDVRESQLHSIYGDSVRFVSRDHAIRSSHILVNAMNLTKDASSPFFNVGYFSKDFLARSPNPLAFINVTRGEIAPESGLLELLTNGALVGLGLDVFSHESKLVQALDGERVLDFDILASIQLIARAQLRTANVYVQPHQAFNSDVAAKTKADEALVHVVAWFKNGAQKFDDELPYY
jgi:D-lactate dehydrogenase